MDSTIYNFIFDHLPIPVRFKDGKPYIFFSALQGLMKNDIEVSIMGLESQTILDELQQAYLEIEAVRTLRDRFSKDVRERFFKILSKIEDQGVEYFNSQYSSKNSLAVTTGFMHDYQMKVSSYPIAFDYCNGLRVSVPDQDWVTTFTDRNTGLKTQMKGSFFTNTKWCIPWDFEISYRNIVLFKHKFDLSGKKVVIGGGAALGDSLAWTPYYKEFKDRNNIQDLWISMKGTVSADLLREHYDDPHIHFMYNSDQEYLQDPEPVYAYYMCGLHFAPAYQPFLTPIPVRNQHLPSVVSWQLNMKPDDAQPLRLTKIQTRRLSDKPYVCIANLSTCHSKNWLNTQGWHFVIQKLQGIGYQVFDIDRDPYIEVGDVIDNAPMPNSSTVGNFSIRERAEVLAGADFFIGPSSGLCWLARAVGCPTVMIGGFTLPINEYDNPYRAWNPHSCTGCLHDGSIELNRFNYYWCPRHQDNQNRIFECSKTITGDMVMHQVYKLMKDYELTPTTEPRKYMCDLNTHLPIKE